MSQTQQPAAPSWEWMMRRPVRILGLGFGTGLSGKAPGTFGTLPAVFVSGLLLGMGMSHTALLVLALILFAIGVRICDTVSRELGQTDHRAIVWDEFAAMMLVLSCVPQGFGWCWPLSCSAFSTSPNRSPSNGPTAASKAAWG